MRPIASTPVASMQNIAAPDSASVLTCVKCQSLASPFTEEYWHIGATMMRLGSSRPRSFIGENRALMGDFRAGGRNVVFLSNETRRFPQPCLESWFRQNRSSESLFDAFFFRRTGTHPGSSPGAGFRLNATPRRMGPGIRRGDEEHHSTSLN